MALLSGSYLNNMLFLFQITCTSVEMWVAMNHSSGECNYVGMKQSAPNDVLLNQKRSFSHLMVTNVPNVVAHINIKKMSTAISKSANKNNRHIMQTYSHAGNVSVHSSQRNSLTIMFRNATFSLTQITTKALCW